MSRSAQSNRHGRGKATSACQACRSAHVKCDSGQPCSNCSSIGLDCVRRAAFQFKYYGVESTPEQLGSQSRDKLWNICTVATPVEWHHSNQGSSQQSQPRGQDVLYHSPSQATKAAAPHAGSTWPAASPPNAQTSPGLEDGISQPFTDREAILIRNFIDNMAQWADAFDVNRTFELEVPRLALHEPILRHAICAFSARHLHRASPELQAEALEHQDKCLRFLIPAMSGLQGIGAEVLAAVAILRQNEEMEDGKLHVCSLRFCYHAS